MTRIRRLLELADHGLIQLVIGGGFIVASILAFVVTFTLLGISPREPIGNDRCTDRQDRVEKRNSTVMLTEQEQNANQNRAAQK